jgi:DNA-binding CsgD family transcriptional regulator
MEKTLSAQVRIKQLCCMELASEEVIPAVLKELQAVLPSSGKTFFWCNKDGQISNLYDDPFGKPELVDVYLQEFYGRPERELNPGLPYVVGHYRGVIEFDHILQVDRKKYLNSDFYNLVLHPARYTDALLMPVHAGGRPLGGLSVWRDLADAPFTAQDKRCLQDLEPFIAHALGACKKARATQAPLVDEDEHVGLIIVDRAGKIQHISAEGRKLLFLATNPQNTPRTVVHESVQLPAQIIELCRNLAAVFEGKEGVGATPACRIHNPWGGFVFRAYWLDHGNPLDSLIGITIKHQIPMIIKALEQTARFSLSRRQMQICLMLVRGYSDADIARNTSMATNTVITHNRRIYDKLNVHNRAELVNKLLEG